MTQKMFLDLETTSLDIQKGRIISIGYALFSEQNALQKQVYHIVRLHEFKIPEESIQIHHITQEISTSQGVEIGKILEELEKDLETCHVLIGHNLIGFDFPYLLEEYKRNQKEIKHLEQIQKEDTMIMSQKGMGRKWGTTLQKMYHMFYKEDIEAHNALNDVIMCVRLYYNLKNIPFEEKNE